MPHTSYALPRWILCIGVLACCCAACAPQPAERAGGAGSGGSADTVRLGSTCLLSLSAEHENQLIQTLLANAQQQWTQDSVLLPNQYDERRYDTRYLFRHGDRDSIMLIRSGYDGQYFLAYAHLASQAAVLSPELQIGQDVQLPGVDPAHFQQPRVLLLCEDEEGYTQLRILVKDRRIESVHLIHTID